MECGDLSTAVVICFNIFSRSNASKNFYEIGLFWQTSRIFFQKVGYSLKVVVPSIPKSGMKLPPNFSMTMPASSFQVLLVESMVID